MDKQVIDLNKSVVSSPSLTESHEPVHDFVPVPPSGVQCPHHQPTPKRVKDEDRKDPSVDTMRRNLSQFWSQRMKEIDNTHEFDGQHALPLTRVKRVMKADQDVKMVSGEAPVVMAKAVEFFIMEMTLRAWKHAEENKRRVMGVTDIAHALSKSDSFDFLVDVLPFDKMGGKGPCTCECSTTNDKKIGQGMQKVEHPQEPSMLPNPIDRENGPSEVEQEKVEAEDV